MSKLRIRKKVMALILGSVIAVTSVVPVGAAKHIHNWNNRFIEYTYVSNGMHQVKEGKCRSCGGIKKMYKESHKLTPIRYGGIVNADKFNEYQRVINRCDKCKGIVYNTRAKNHNYKKSKSVKNTRYEKKEYDVYKCNKCGYTYADLVRWHPHDYTKKRIGGKCKICSKPYF